MTSKSSFIQTDTGNLVSRASSILGSGNIILGGKTIIEPGVIIRGDLRRTAITAAGATGTSSNSNIVVVAIGKYTYLAQNCAIRPGSKSYKGVFSYYPVKIGDYVTIGEGSIIEAAQIGNGVEIGKNCIIGSLAIIKDNAKILDNSVVAPGAIIASLVEWSGNPAISSTSLTPADSAVALMIARWSNTLPESTPESLETRAKDFYSQFLAEL